MDALFTSVRYLTWEGCSKQKSAKPTGLLVNFKPQRMEVHEMVRRVDYVVKLQLASRREMITTDLKLFIIVRIKVSHFHKSECIGNG